MEFEDIKARFDRIFAAASHDASRDDVPMLRQALIDFKVGMGEMRDALARTGQELALARRELEDYGRRGALAVGIGDDETARVADAFTARARERVALLERKAVVQRDELAIAERDYAETRARFDAASRGIPYDEAAAPGADAVSEAMQLDQRAREAAVEAQLAHLKKKLGDTK